MFTRIQAKDYRCLRSIDQSLGPFHALVGPNASGKTTFLEVIDFFGELIRRNGNVLEAVSARSSDFRNLVWSGAGSAFQLAVEAEIPESVREHMERDLAEAHSGVRYEIEIGYDDEVNEIGLNHEALWLIKPSTGERERRQPELFPADSLPGDSVFAAPGKSRRRLISNNPGKNANYYADGRKTYNPSFRIGRRNVALASIPADFESFVVAPWFRNLLAEGVQSLVLNSRLIRNPSPPGLGRQFKPDGSNLPWVVAELRKSSVRFRAWLDHIRTALDDVVDIDTIERPEDKHCYLVVKYRNGAEVPSWLVSDGTLRLLALTIPAYLESLDGVLLIEEPENGIHPRAIETVVQSLSSIYDSQVLIATHSAVVLGILDPAQVLCFAKNAEGATDIVAGDLHPALRNWRLGEPDFGVLFATGILS